MKRIMKWAGLFVAAWMLVGFIGTIFLETPETSSQENNKKEEKNKNSTGENIKNKSDISKIAENNWDFTSKVTYSKYNNYLGLFITVENAWNAVSAMEKLGNRIIKVMRLAADNNLRLRVSAVMPTNKGNNKVMMLEWNEKDITALDAEGEINEKQEHNLKKIFSMAREVSRDPAGYEYTNAFCKDRNISNNIPICKPAPYKN